MTKPRTLAQLAVVLPPEKLAEKRERTRLGGFVFVLGLVLAAYAAYAKAPWWAPVALGGGGGLLGGMIASGEYLKAGIGSLGESVAGFIAAILRAKGGGA